CLNVLMAGAGYPMVATHDPRLVAVADERARWYGRGRGSYEDQMLFGGRPGEQRRLGGARGAGRGDGADGERGDGLPMRRGGRGAEGGEILSFFCGGVVSGW